MNMPAMTNSARTTQRIVLFIIFIKRIKRNRNNIKVRMSTQMIETMLAARGVDVSSPVTIEPGVVKYGTIVVSSKEARMSEKIIREFVNKFPEYGATYGILVIPSTPPSDMILNIVSSMSNVLQLFHEAQLAFDITKHRKVPAHRILSNEEVEKMFEKFHISIPQIMQKMKDDKIDLDPGMPVMTQLGFKHKEYMPMPYIWSQDAVARWIGAKPGDVIEIMRKSETSGATPYYRFCVASVI
jgi:DNA-directed RNA polymerase subunit H (RpoH/RPB5)